MKLEFDHIIQHALDLCVELFAQSVGTESELFVSVFVSINSIGCFRRLPTRYLCSSHVAPSAAQTQ
jgi:hypothetical protein